MRRDFAFCESSLFVCVCLPPQERQRLETILTLCAEYNKGESVGLDPLGSGQLGFPGSLGDCSGRRPSLENLLGGTPTSPAALRLAQRQRESDEENLKEECSSTESTHQEVRTSPAPSRVSAVHNGEPQVRGHAPFPTHTLPLHAAEALPWLLHLHGSAGTSFSAVTVTELS